VTISLRRSTGDQEADQALHHTLSRLDAELPNRILSCYLSGSFAEAAAMPASDLDGLVIFKGELEPGERERFQHVSRRCSLLTSILMDLAVRAEEDLYREGELPAKAASRILVYGPDLRDRIPPLPPEVYAQSIVQGSLFYFGHSRGTNGTLTFPLDYPDPSGEFYGYEQRGYRGLDGWQGAGTKALVGGTTLAATALVAMATGYCAVRQHESVLAYGSLVDDEWTRLIAEIYAACRLEWFYAVPSVREDRKRLRELCRSVLDFENHYLRVCRWHALQLARSDDLRLGEYARRFFTRVRFEDGDAAAALEELEPTHRHEPDEP
jgi:hypothetical protein